MKLVNLLNENKISIHSDANTPEDILHELTSLSLEDGNDQLLEKTLKRLIKRNTEASFYLHNGVAMPHIKVEGIQESLLSFATSKKGIIWDEDSEERAHLIFLIITPIHQNSVMLQSLASLAKLCRSKENRENLIQVKSPSRALKIIEESGVDIKKHIVARDIMRDNYPTLNSDMIMRDAAKILAASELDGLPVVDENENLIGELSSTDLLKVGSTPYVDLLSDDTFLTNLEPFEEYFKKEKSTTVFEIMNQEPIVLQPQTPITKVAHQMIQQKCNRIYITEKQKLIGMVYINDIISKIHAL